MANEEQNWVEFDEDLYREDEDSDEILNRGELVFYLPAYIQRHYSSDFVENAEEEEEELENAEEEEEEEQDSDTSSSASSSKGTRPPAQQGSSDSSDADDSGQDDSLSLHPEGASGSSTDPGEGCSGGICEKDKNKLKSCFNCGALGHLAYNCPDKSCRYCFQPGHTSSSCSIRKYLDELSHHHDMKGHFSDACTEQSILEEINPRDKETKAQKENSDFPRGGTPKKKRGRKHN